MSSKRTPGRSLDEWMELVIQCRQSGLSDAEYSGAAEPPFRTGGSRHTGTAIPFLTVRSTAR